MEVPALDLDRPPLHVGHPQRRRDHVHDLALALDPAADAEEATRGTNPTNTNTDGDGFPDGFEVAAGSDPLDSNSVLLTFPLFLDFSRLDDPTQRLQ